ncbi:MAG: molecular chaperone TorD family protein [Thermoguttaceae bacterium]|jgi:nitrate reductase assembly molybdenum cofactor insertion protein NarJ
MSSETSLPTHKSEELLRDAAKWRLIGLLLECPRDDWFAQVVALSAEVDNEQLRHAAAQAQQEASEGLYHTTFGPGGPAAPREVSYHDSLLAGQTLAQLRAQYEAFGYASALEEAPDHIAVETGFMAYLRLKEAYALHAGARGDAEITAAAARDFLENRLSAIAGPLAEILACSGIGYFELVASALCKRS